jgi:hypothetical protein
MALIGYQIEKQKIEDKIRAIEGQLKGKRVSISAAPMSAVAEAPKRILSPAARKRIAMAQKKRWAEHRRKAALAKQE